MESTNNKKERKLHFQITYRTPGKALIMNTLHTQHRKR